MGIASPKANREKADTLNDSKSTMSADPHGSQGKNREHERDHSHRHGNNYYECYFFVARNVTEDKQNESDNNEQAVEHACYSHGST